MHKPQDQVRELHREVMNAPTSPAEPKLRNPQLRASLILEEAIETVVALVGSHKALNMLQHASDRLDEKEFEKGSTEPDLIEAIDGCIDLLVVTYGTCEDIGIDAEPFFDEVQRSNMAKKDGPMRADGKRLKPPGWTPPDIAGVLAKLNEAAS